MLNCLLKYEKKVRCYIRVKPKVKHPVNLVIKIHTTFYLIFISLKEIFNHITLMSAILSAWCRFAINSNFLILSESGSRGSTHRNSIGFLPGRVGRSGNNSSQARLARTGRGMPDSIKGKSVSVSTTALAFFSLSISTSAAWAKFSNGNTWLGRKSTVSTRPTWPKAAFITASVTFVEMK